MQTKSLGTNSFIQQIKNISDIVAIVIVKKKNKELGNELFHLADEEYF